jgi:hypothetical protein
MFRGKRRARLLSTALSRAAHEGDDPVRKEDPPQAQDGDDQQDQGGKKVTVTISEVTVTFAFVKT